MVIDLSPPPVKVSKIREVTQKGGRDEVFQKGARLVPVVLLLKVPKSKPS